MAQDSWPSPAHNSRAVTDSEYEILSAPGIDDGVQGDPTQTAVVSAAAGLAVTVRANVSASVRGFSWTSGTTAFTLPVAANTSGKVRQDWVVLRLDRSTWTVRAAIRQGTPGSGLPALVQDPPTSGVYEITLAQVNVPNNATSVTVTRNELYAGVAIRPALSARPNTKPRRGDMEYQTDTGRLVLWSGSAWRTIYEDSGEVTLTGWVSTWNAASANVAVRRNGWVNIRISVNRLSSAFLPNDSDGGSRILRLPSDGSMNPSRWHYFPGAFTNGARTIAQSLVEVRSDGDVWCRSPSVSVPPGAHLNLSVTYPL
ncbi:hypothetical protein [Streptomyces sp. NRRL F-5630]|uniref:hypothetical protein n=1 Tax=Streptomyces sp. NRRL F-5630 TaxID=1463864 RepID=UPI003D758E6B